MRQIGIAGRTCSIKDDAPCNPYVVCSVCHSCAVRPMKIYQGNSGSKKNIERGVRDGVGAMLCAAWRDPSPFPYYALDNGAYSAWSNGKAWDSDHFEDLLRRYLRAPVQPDFVVCPDKVAAGTESLQFSLSWLRYLPSGPRYYLAVQDGMSIEDVDPEVRKFSGLFVGGTMEWKLGTAQDWIRLAHKHQRPCHIGRIGPGRRILWAARIGADSIDSTTWVQQDRWHHIQYAKAQQSLEVKASYTDIAAEETISEARHRKKKASSSRANDDNSEPGKGDIQ